MIYLNAAPMAPPNPTINIDLNIFNIKNNN